MAMPDLQPYPSNLKKFNIVEDIFVIPDLFLIIPVCRPAGEMHKLILTKNRI